MLAWHFLKEDRRLKYGDREEVTVGKTITVDGELKLCNWGLHGSNDIIDAQKYAPGPILCRVELGGEIIWDTDKCVARQRTVLWMLDATWVLHEFACRCAERVLLATEITDECCWWAIRAKRGWVHGCIADDELAAARDAARDAAWGVARDAARYAARYEACDTARYTARYAARYAAWVELNNELESMVNEERKRIEESDA